MTSQGNIRHEMVNETSEKRKQGAIAGAAAFVAGLVATLVIENGKTGDETELLELSAMGESDVVTIGEIAEDAAPPSSLEIATWLYHEAHMASIDVSLSLPDEEASAMAELASISLSLAIEPSTLTYLLPILVLGGAGYWLADQFAHDTAEAAAKTGAHVALGYGALAVLTAFLFEWSATNEGETISVAPDLASALLLTGVVYPVVVGAAGGYLQHERSDDATEAAAAEGTGSTEPRVTGDAEADPATAAESGVDAAAEQEGDSTEEPVDDAAEAAAGDGDRN